MPRGVFKRREETKAKMSASLKGHVGVNHTLETKKRIGDSHRGIPLSVEHRKKISESVRKLYNTPEYTERRNCSLSSHETKQKMREAQLGERSHRWKGGISFSPYCQKFNRDFKERVRAFFGNVCVECGKTNGDRKLNVHHVNFNKMGCCDGTKPLFVPLCNSCHSKTNTRRGYWEEHFTELINLKYGGECYMVKLL